ncbi:unnamed protein product [Hydatigera taeniaeformis]|uniref:Reverse transcriptase domain-containing protein n=1 Tax=Hydatigena taeniaeformis TaxID=6205 RepID=A0A0R3WRN6_HYDTA|nr:unnamed protein product [Hydatigera taeniaeformis]
MAEMSLVENLQRRIARAFDFAARGASDAVDRKEQSKLADGENRDRNSPRTTKHFDDPTEQSDKIEPQDYAFQIHMITIDKAPKWNRETQNTKASQRTGQAGRSAIQ